MPATTSPLTDVRASQRKLAKAREAVELANVALADAMVAAVEGDATYAEVGKELGMTRASAHAFAKRWSSRAQG